MCVYTPIKFPLLGYELIFVASFKDGIGSVAYFLGLPVHNYYENLMNFF